MEGGSEGVVVGGGRKAFKKFKVFLRNYRVRRGGLGALCGAVSGEEGAVGGRGGDMWAADKGGGSCK